MPCPDRIDGGYAWAVGDLAESISGNWRRPSGGPIAGGPRAGEGFIITGIAEATAPCGCIVVCLQFARFDKAWFCAEDFRRITPRAEQLAPADAGFLAQWIPGFTTPGAQRPGQGMGEG